MRLPILGMLVAAGCGNVQGNRTDAATDADLLDADLTAPLTVITNTHVTDGGVVNAPAGMIDIVALRPDGSVSDMLKTDATGHASVKVFPGGTVTAIYPHVNDTGVDLATFAGVKPGETLTFGQRFGSSQNNDLGTMTYSWPTLGGASFYDVFTPCGGFFAGSAATTSAVFHTSSNCDRQPYEAQFVAFNANGTVIGVGFGSVQQFQNGGSLGIGGWNSPQNFTSTFSGLPDVVTNLSYELFTVGSGGDFLFSNGFNGQPTGGAFTSMLPWGTVGSRTLGELFVARNGQFDESVVVDGLQSFSTTWTVAGSTLTPWMSSQVVNGPARMVLYFPSSSAGADTTQGTVTNMNWTRETTSAGTTTDTPYNWTIISPPELTAYNLPPLPAPFDVDLPIDTDFFNGFVRMVQFPNVADYDAFKAIGERNITCPDCAVREGEISRAIFSE